MLEDTQYILLCFTSTKYLEIVARNQNSKAIWSSTNLRDVCRNRMFNLGKKEDIFLDGVRVAV